MKFRIKITILIFLIVVVAVFSLTYVSIEALYNVGEGTEKISERLLTEQAGQGLEKSNALQAKVYDLQISMSGEGASRLAEIIEETYDMQIEPEDLVEYFENNSKRLDNGVIIEKEDALASCFSPAGTEVDEKYIRDMLLAELADKFSVNILSDERIVAVYFATVRNYIRYYPNIGLHNILPADFMPSERPWFKAAISPDNIKKSLVWTSVYEDAADHGLLVTAAVPAYRENGELIGVVGVDIELGDIAKDFIEKENIEEGYYFLMDKDNRIITMPSKGYEEIFGQIPNYSTLGVSLSGAKPEFSVLVDHLDKKEKGSTVIEFDGKKILTVFSKMEKTGWTLVSVVDGDNYFSALKEIDFQVYGLISDFITKKLFPLSVILLLLIFIVGSIGFSAIMNPLNSLSKRSRSIVKEKLGIDISEKVQMKDEVGRLRFVIDTMGEALDDNKKTTKYNKKELEDRVKNRTKDLNDKIAELEVVQNSIVEREMKMVEMKEELKELKNIINKKNQI